MKRFFGMTVAACALMVAVPAYAQNATTVTTQTTVDQVGDTVVTHEKETVVVHEGAERPITFYYYDTPQNKVISGSALTENVFKIWDKDGNGYISPQEYYNNELVMYEPVEYNNRTYKDIDGDGKLELAKDEYILRLHKLPLYTNVNTDGKDGISAHEFTGAGFQITDDDDDNQVSYNELKEAFYKQPRMASEPELYNR